jgi:hypothetical protein
MRDRRLRKTFDILLECCYCVILASLLKLLKNYILQKSYYFRVYNLNVLASLEVARRR